MIEFDEALAREVDEYAWRAEQAHRRGQTREAAEHFARAAELEQRAAEASSAAPLRIRSALALSSVALWYKAGRWAEVERLALVWLAHADPLTAEVRDQLRDLLGRAWVEAQIDADALEQTLPVELRLIGRDTCRGLAPAKLVRRVQASLVSLLERVGQWKQALRYRERASDRKTEQIEQVEILQAPTLAGGYGIRLYVRSTRADELSTEELLRTCFELLEANEDEAQWEQLVPDPRVRRGLLECVRGLCPDEERVAEVVCSSPTWRVTLPEVRLDAERRARLERLLTQADQRAGPQAPSDELRREPAARGPRWLANDE
ncbi:MAG: hypothetical protein R6X02_09635 [Enhygromyxa sp.]